MLLVNVAIVLVTLVSPAHAVEQNVTVQTDAAPIENPPLPRPKPLLLEVTGENPAVLISAFRHQHGEGSVAVSAVLTGVAQEQANAMAMRDSLDHNVLAPFSNRISRGGYSRAAENIAYGHADFASTLDQWTNSAAHRANLLLHGAKWIGVAHAQNGHRMYWAMVIGAKQKVPCGFAELLRMSAFGGTADIEVSGRDVCTKRTSQSNPAMSVFDAAGRPLFPEVMVEIDAIKKGAIAGHIFRRDHKHRRGATPLPWITARGDLDNLRSTVKKIVRAAKLRDELSFSSFRHGGFTEGADADLTDAELRAAGRHRSARQLPT